MASDYTLVKKYRFDEWFHPASRTKVGLYLHPERGTFYAFVPETKAGRILSATTKADLLHQLQTTGVSWLEPEWVRTIVLTLPKPIDNDMVWMRENQAAWSPETPDRAGVVVGLGVEVIDVSTSNDGQQVCKEVHLDLPEHMQQGIPRVHFRRPIQGHIVEVAFTPEMYALALDLRSRLRGLNHALRTALYADEPVVALSQAMAHLPHPDDPNPILPPAEDTP